MDTQKEIEFDLMGLLRHLRDRLWIIVAVTVVFGFGGYMSAKMLSVPIYTATTQVYVYQQDNNGINSSNLSVATQVRRDCAVIIKGESVTREVIARLGLKGTPRGLSSGISVTSDDNTRILNISYTSTNPELAAMVVNTVREVAAEQIKELMKEDVLKTIYEAEIPVATSTTNLRRSMFTWGGIGGGVTIAILVLLFLMDDSIRSEDDVEAGLGLSTLAVIPVSSELRVKRGNKTKKGRGPGRRF